MADLASASELDPRIEHDMNIGTIKSKHGVHGSWVCQAYPAILEDECCQDGWINAYILMPQYLPEEMPLHRNSNLSMESMCPIPNSAFLLVTALTLRPDAG